jgi:hypothetical protein
MYQNIDVDENRKYEGDKKIINFPGVLEIIIFYNFNMIIRNYVRYISP